MATRLPSFQECERLALLMDGEARHSRTMCLVLQALRSEPKEINRHHARAREFQRAAELLSWLGQRTDRLELLTEPKRGLL